MKSTTGKNSKNTRSKATTERYQKCDSAGQQPAHTESAPQWGKFGQTDTT